ncbi:MAG TPA: serine hydrolase domain-containing protein [Candidatus Binatia bacterium]|nr:serine hydrolase domain-containing protein [Candidatus Binatia bacterium]
MRKLCFDAPCRLLVAALIAAIVAVPSFLGPTPAFAVDVDLESQLREALRDAQANSGAPGMSISVVTADGRQWSGAAGRHTDGRLVMIDDPLMIGSVTKTFTAAIVLALVDEGRIQLDAPTAAYLPNVALVRGTTVRQLLNHTSGIADLYRPAKEVLHGAPGATLSSNAVLHPIGPAYFAPGTGYAYSNTNYYLLGLIIEVVTGRSFGEELQARFTGPLGLEHTRLLTAADPQLPAAWSTAFWTSGAMVSRPSELARWGHALYGGAVLSGPSLRRMLDFRSGHLYGEGAQLLRIGDHRFVGHSGLLYETTTYLVRLAGVTVAIAGTAPHTDLGAALTEGYSGRPSLLELIGRLAG